MRQGVHYLQLKISVLYQQVGVLRVDIYQFVRQDLQFLQGHDAVIDERATLAVGVQLTTDDTVVKRRLNDTFILPVRDGFAVRPGAQYQRQCTEDNTLTGTGLTCQHRETLAEIDIQMADQGVVLYV